VGAGVARHRLHVEGDEAAGLPAGLARMVPASVRPSPGTIFSATARARWDEAIRVVRSVTKPRSTARPGLGEFGGDQDVDVAGGGREGEDRGAVGAAGSFGAIST
jgi:hypothetical protein